MKKLVIALSTLAFSFSSLVVACGSSDSSDGETPAGSAGTSSTGGAGGDAGAGGSTAGAGGSTAGAGGSAAGAGGSAAGAGGSTAGAGGSAAGAGGSTSQAKATLKLNVPADFSGTTRELDVVLVPSIPPAGPPAAVLVANKMPVVTAGKAIDLSADVATVPPGDYFVVAVLYMDGGGTLSPKAGVDYQAATSAKVKFDGKSVDLGTLDLKK